MSAQKVAIVTGSNKGIGFAIVELLCKKLGSGWDVYLTSRDEGRGKAAVQELEGKGVHPKFHQLDIDDKASIEKLGSFVKSTYGGLDILVNNAAIALPCDQIQLVVGQKPTEGTPFSEEVEKTVRTNFWSLVDVCDVMFPLLRPHARVVNVSSGVSGMMLDEAGPELQKRLTQEMSVDDVKNLMREFAEAAKKGNHRELGWPSTSYGVSKMGARLVSYPQARNLQADPREDLVLNSCCPGYVNTDLNSRSGTATVLEGADTPVYLATLEPNVSKDFIGKHFYKRKVIPWAVGTVVTP